MELEIDPTSDTSIKELIDSLPETVKEKIQFREYDRYTQQVFFYAIDSFTKVERDNIQLILRDHVYHKVLVSIIRVAILPGTFVEIDFDPEYFGDISEEE